MNKFLQNQAIVVDGAYHVTHTKNDDSLPCDRDTEPGEPPIELLVESSCCLGIASGLQSHSAECQEITAVETPKSLERHTPTTRRRSGEFKL